MRPPTVRGSRSTKPGAPVEPFPHQILVQGPTSVNVPVFALAIEKDRFETEVKILTSFTAARLAVGRNAASALRAGAYGSFQVVHRRQRLARQSINYSVWLAFASRDDAKRFSRVFRVGR